MQTKTAKLIEDLDIEIKRVKDFLNTNGYNNSTAFNSIVRKYRKELKEYSRIVRIDQQEDQIIDYRDC